MFGKIVNLELKLQSRFINLLISSDNEMMEQKDKCFFLMKWYKVMEKGVNL